MAAEKRDLIAPAGELKGSERGVSAAAVQRYREGKVSHPARIDISGG